MTEQTPYVTATQVISVLPSAARDTDPALVDAFVSEAVSRAEHTVGPLPADDAEIKGIVRDLAAARTLEKVMGAQSRESVELAVNMRRDALARLQERGLMAVDNTQSDVDGSLVHNIDPLPLWVAESHGLTANRRFRTGDWW